MASYGVTDVTLSGGEPTLHPDLFPLIRYFHKKGICVHILSNGERFSDKAYADQLLELRKDGELTVTTTFHSRDAAGHEYQNGAQGSFLRSLDGLKYLDRNGLQVSIKHCITAYSYRHLPAYIHFVLESFSPRAEIQFWGIDLSGLEREAALENFAGFLLIKPYIEEAMDVFEASGRSREQVLTINNLPLCMCNSYYWRYFTSPGKDSYIDHNKGGSSLKADSGPVSIHCGGCPFRNQCMGAYFSDFDILGDDIVSVPKAEAMANSYRPCYGFYTGQAVEKMVFSPYLVHRLSRKGYVIMNYLTGGQLLLRLRTEQVLHLQKLLTEGVLAGELIACLDGFGLNGAAVMNESMGKGIIE